MNIVSIITNIMLWSKKEIKKKKKMFFPNQLPFHLLQYIYFPTSLRKQRPAQT